MNHIWIVDSADGAVYRYHAAAGRTSGSQTAASLFQLASGNTNAQGIADPPPVSLEIGLPTPAALPDGLFSFPSGLSSGIKDRALGDWSTSAWADNWHALGHVGANALRSNGSVDVASAFHLPSLTTRHIGSRANVDVVGSHHVDRLKNYASAVDSLFGESDLNIDADGLDREWSSRTSWESIDDLIESPAENSVFEAFR